MSTTNCNDCPQPEEPCVDFGLPPKLPTEPIIYPEPYCAECQDGDIEVIPVIDENKGCDPCDAKIKKILCEQYGICEGYSCTKPNFAGIAINAATCNGSTANNNGTINVNGISVGTKWGISYSSTYKGPNYLSATELVDDEEDGILIGVSNIQNYVVDQPFVIRIFNGHNMCYLDIKGVIPGSKCACQTVIDIEVGEI